MPYHIFKLFPNKTVEHVETHEKYRETKKIVEEMRSTLTVSDNYKLKMIFAANEKSGAKLLTTEREFQPYGDD